MSLMDMMQQALAVEPSGILGMAGIGDIGQRQLAGPALERDRRDALDIGLSEQ